MGEYIETTLGSYKLGTGYFFTEITFDEFKELMRDSSVTNKNELYQYLNGKNIWRFPLSWEKLDTVTVKTLNDTYPSRAKLRIELNYPFIKHLKHNDIVISRSAIGKTENAYNTNIWIPCPHSEDFNLKSTTIHNKLLIKGVCYSEEYTEKGALICECGYCGREYIFDTEGAYILCEELEKEKRHPEIIQTIKALYEPK